MKTPEINYALYDKTIGFYESIIRHKKSKPNAEKSDILYLELMHKTLRDARYAKEEGKPLVAYTVMIPSDILLAMDIVPLPLEFVTGAITQITDTSEDILGAAKAYGFAPELCSIHRILNGHLIQGNLPKPDAILWSNQVCDNTGKAGDPMMEIYGAPGFFIDRPFRYREQDVQYLSSELAKMVAFLEDATNRKMDWDRLKETVKKSQEFIDLAREINELRKAVPAPMKSRRFPQINILNGQFFSSAPETLEIMRQIRDEVKANVEAGKGAVPEEKYRLLNLFIPPNNMHSLFDWLEKEHGAVSVMEPYCCNWGEGEMDPEKPLESLARKCFFQPICRQMHGPVAEGVLIDSISDAKTYQAEGVIFWAHVSCREACACVRMLKDGLRDEAGIPMLVIDNDLADPTYVTMDQIKDKLESFLEVLDDRK